jgi:hypothetical protein
MWGMPMTTNQGRRPGWHGYTPHRRASQNNDTKQQTKQRVEEQTIRNALR